MNKLYYFLLTFTLSINGCDNSNDSSDSTNIFNPKLQATLVLRDIYGLEKNRFLRGEAITFDLEVENVSSEEVTLNFGTPRIHDFYIKSESGEEIWRSGSLVIQVPTSVIIPGGQSVRLSETLVQNSSGGTLIDVGSYIAYGSLLDQSPIAQSSFTIHQTPESTTLEQYLKRGISYRANPAPVLQYSPELTGIFFDSSIAATDTTNVQEAGVDEADLIEFDGERLYVGFQKNDNTDANSSSYSAIEVYSSDSSTASTELLGSIGISDNAQFESLEGIYLRATESARSLAVIESSYYVQSVWNMSSNLPYLPYNSSTNYQTTVTLVDVDDPAAMNIELRWEIDGYLLSSRRIDNYLYLVTRYIPDVSQFGLIPFPETDADKQHNASVINQLELEEMLPVVNMGEGGTQSLVSEFDCHIPSESQNFVPGNSYFGGLVLITVIDLDNPGTLLSGCLASDASHIYASQEALYLLDRNYGQLYNQEDFDLGFTVSTSVYKYALQEMDISFRGEGSIGGFAPCNPVSYCLGESDGVLRFLSQQNPVIPIFDPALQSQAESYGDYTLNLLAEDGSGNLTKIAQLPNESRPQTIGKPGELVYSMRSYKDYAYIVTFDKVDPLYVIDLSNSQDPFIAGELEVTGFSDYLHPVGNDLLLGIGKEAVYESESDMTWYQGVKIELFDVSDPVNPSSIASDVIGKRGSYTPLTYDTHVFASALSSENETLVSFPVSVSNRLPVYGDPGRPSQFYNWDHSALYVYRIENGLQTPANLERVGSIVSEQYTQPDQVYGSFLIDDRSVFHDQTIHYLHNGLLYSELLDNLDY